ncbi:hypothetical protein INT48_003077 [Thamnidium elegans]|uniref:Uncharacterized protein n=1 Tax=Thamnidium elegans TaxID=101142 RepID=A0A8H7SRH1_9FUNG|nr:hypothetical protein INT48_003077 [Thamnidium elegans]
MQTKNNVIVQISLLFLIQWLSIAVIVLNALALNMSKDQGLVIAESGPQDFILLIMASASLIIVSLLLCVSLPMLLSHTIELSKKLLAIEIVFSILVIALWTTATSIILTKFNLSSICHNKAKIEINSNVCNLVNTTIIVAFVTIGLWCIMLVTILYTFAELTKLSFVRPHDSSSPYENVKIQISANTNPMTEYDTDTIAETTLNQKDARNHQLSEPDTILTLKNWHFDFEPMDIDLTRIGPS